MIEKFKLESTGTITSGVIPPLDNTFLPFVVKNSFSDLSESFRL